MSRLAEVLKDRCYKGRTVTVLKSNCGYYIGTIDGNEPYCRLSAEYYKSKEEAQYALDNRTFTERDAIEVMYCNGSCRKCLI